MSHTLASTAHVSAQDALRVRSLAFQRLVQTYGAPLQRLAAAYERDEDQREDLLQDILFALWKALPSFRGECSERTFVYRVAHNRALTHQRRASTRNARTRPIEEGTHVEDAAPGVDAILDTAQRRERLLAAVRRLPSVHRQIVLLRLEDMTNGEIAGILGISENAVAVRLTRARQALAALLGDQA